MVDVLKIVGKFHIFFLNSEKRTRLIVPRIGKSLLVIFVSYILASTLVATVVLFVNPVPPAHSSSSISPTPKTVDIPNPLNHRNLRKVVVARNIFNSGGEVPDESSLDQVASSGSVFNVNAPCTKTSLNIELMGLIYQPHGISLATIQEKGVDYADIYQEGDTILGSERAIVFKIKQYQVIINNSGVKECLDLEDIDKSVKQKFYAAAPSSTLPAPGGGGAEPGAGGGGDYQHYTLSPEYVEKALGPGFGKILESGRLVPHNKDGQMIGFKLINVEAGSIFTKMGLNSGDVITKVNDISMAQPDQGFALYQALQDSREIHVEFLKGANDPSTLTLDIK